MRVYLLKDADFERLMLSIDNNPEQSQGSSNHMSENDRRVYRDAHRFYNHRILRWIDGCKKEES